MSDFLGDYSTNNSCPEMYRCQEPRSGEEPVRDCELSPAIPEYAAPANHRRPIKKRRPISPLSLLSAVIIATVTTISIGYLNVSAALTYVTENTAGVILTALWVTSEQDTPPLTYELIERTTDDVVLTGLVPDQSTVLAFSQLESSTGYALMIYNGQSLVRSFSFSTSAIKEAAALSNAASIPATGQTTANPGLMLFPTVSATPSPAPALSPTPAPTYRAADGTVLTGAEAANAGMHTYQFTGTFYGTYNGDKAGTETKTLVFKTVSGQKMLGDGTENYYTSVEENIYTEVISGLAITIKFDPGGFTAHAAGAFDYDYRLVSSAPTSAPTVNSTALTAAEAANAGTHMYYTTGEIFGPSGGKIVPSEQPITLVFETVNGTKIMTGDADGGSYTRVAENIYESSINGIKLTAVFTEKGFSILAEGAYEFNCTLLP